MLPTSILRVWLLALISLGILGGSAYLGHEWYRRSWSYDHVRHASFFDPQFGFNEATLLLAAAVFLIFVAIAGKLIVRAVLSVTSSSTRRGSADATSPYASPEPIERQRARRPDGSELEVKVYGARDGIPMVLSHGWSMNSDEWNYLKRELSDRYRLIVWDEPGLGASTRPANRDYSLENLARDLEAVLALSGGQPAILLGHSIGGMITLTFCRLFPEALGSRVAGLVLAHTTYTNPVRTAKGAAFYSLIEKPVLVPLMYLTIALSPLVWLMNWLSYRNGSAHLSTKRSSFGGTESWEQIDFAAHFQAKASPAVVARGMLGMMRYDATATLKTVTVPTLVVAGDRDPLTKPEASARIRTDVPNARLVTLSPAKHLGLIEHHAQFAKELRQLAQHSATAAPDVPLA